MRSGQWRRSLTLLLAAALLAGCTSAEPQPDPTESTSSPAATETPTPTNSPSDPFAVPDEITPEYVDLVVNKIYERHGELLRELLSQDPDPSAVMPVEMREHFAGIFDGQYLQRQIDEGDETLQGQRQNLRIQDSLGQLHAETRRVVAANQGCIVSIGKWENTAVTKEGFAFLAAFALERDLAGNTSDNPTGWLLSDVALNLDPDGNPNPDDVMLEATLADLTEAAITTSCTEEDEL